MTAGAAALLLAGAAVTPALTQPADALERGDGTVITDDVTSSRARLPLGPSGLPETRTSETLRPGVTLTRIDRGPADAEVPWVVELSIPAGSSNPDPDAPARSVQDKASAQELVTDLRAAGFDGRAEPVRQPAVADVAAGVIGYRVRLTQSHPSKSAADAAVAKLKGEGFSARSWSAGWDGGSTARGHWSVNVLTIDPKTFTGRLTGTYGPDLEERETTTDLARSAGATAAVNGGFFTMDPAAGAEGDPSGIGVYDGDFASEPVGDRPALVLQKNARRTAVTRPTWEGSVRIGPRTIDLDGTNRVPGLIRNCGGDASDSPTELPLHDTTCTDPSELVSFDTAFGPRTPSGAGTEVVLDRSGRVDRVLRTRGVQLQRGKTSVQGIGRKGSALRSLDVGDRVGVKEKVDLRAPRTSHTSVVGGGPELLRSGSEHITQQRDGMQHVDDPSFDYGWVLQRNPRTIAGTDTKGRTVLVTMDGRQPDQLGASLPEAAAVAKSLGMEDAINLDGGGSTAMSVKDHLVSNPSDAAGERPVGDAIVVR